MTDYADLEKRLRQEARDMENHYTTRELSTEAADALASLTRELEEAKAAVLPFIEYLQHDQIVEPDGAQEIWLDDSAVPLLAALYALGARLSRDHSDPTKTGAPGE